VTPGKEPESYDNDSSELGEVTTELCELVPSSRGPAPNKIQAEDRSPANNHATPSASALAPGLSNEHFEVLDYDPPSARTIATTSPHVQALPRFSASHSSPIGSVHLNHLQSPSLVASTSPTSSLAPSWPFSNVHEARLFYHYIRNISPWVQPLVYSIEVDLAHQAYR
jgi:hypothetical protein